MTGGSINEEILLLETSCQLVPPLAESFTPPPPHEQQDTKDDGTNNEDDWDELLETSPLVCDMVVFSLESPDLIRFAQQEFAPCGQRNLLVFPPIANAQKYQVGFYNCAMVVTLPDVLRQDENDEFAEWEIAAMPDEYEWVPSSSSNSRGAGGPVVALSVVFDVSLAREKFGWMFWEQQQQEEMLPEETQPVSPQTPPVAVLVPNDNNHDDTVTYREPESLLMPPVLTTPVHPLLPTEILHSSSHVPSATLGNSTNHSQGNTTRSHHHHHQERDQQHAQHPQLQVLEGLIANELEQIQYLLFFIGVIAMALVVFLGWALWDAGRGLCRRRRWTTTTSPLRSTATVVTPTCTKPTIPSSVAAAVPSGWSQVSPLSLENPNTDTAPVRTIPIATTKPKFLPVISPERETPHRQTQHLEPPQAVSSKRASTTRMTPIRDRPQPVDKPKKPNFVLRPLDTCQEQEIPISKNKNNHKNKTLEEPPIAASSFISDYWGD